MNTINDSKNQNHTGQPPFPKKVDLLLFFLKGCKRYFILSVLLTSLVSLLELLNPKIISYTVDTVLGGKEPSLPAWLLSMFPVLRDAARFRTHLVLIALVVVLIAVLCACFRYLFELMNSKGVEKLLKRMRDLLFARIMELPFSWHSQNHTGDIIQRCTSDVDTVRMFLSEQLTALFRIAVLLAMALYFMISIHPLLTLISAVFVPIIVLYSLFFEKRIAGTFENADIQEGKLSAIAQENLTGVRVVRAFGREQYERERFEEHNYKYTQMWIKLMRILAAFWSAGDLVSGLQVMLIITIGAVLCVQDHITVGNYIAFVAYNAMLTWPVRELGRVISDMSKAGISIERLRYIMNSEPEQEAADAQDCDLSGDICFDHVTYRYEQSTEDTIRDVNITIPEGSTIGILGGTASGKSTLMFLLDRLYPLGDGQGRITIGGRDIRKISLKSLRGGIGMVLQEPFLFSRSLAENIAITQTDSEVPDMDEVRAAANIACLTEAVEHFTRGFDTPVGERGVTLSGGQKQRTAIAQTLIRKPKIMIFDDSLSAVDAQTDAKIRSRLKDMKAEAVAKGEKPATTILISHRITTLQQADQIIVMDHGRIREQGTHEELLAKGGIYRKIYDIQTNSEEP